MRTKNKILILLILQLHMTVLHAGNKEVESDTLYSYGTRATTIANYKLILPISFFMIGAWGTRNNWLRSTNHNVKNRLSVLRKNAYFHADDYIQYLPVAAHIGLGMAGVESKHTLKERTIITATSYLAMGIMVNGLKLAVNEMRPDFSKRNSFPSGHTATAFMGAELVRLEYGNGYGTGAYAIATGIAFLRLYNNRHWLNDVIAGAGIGILSAHIGHCMLPITRKLFERSKRKSSVVAVILPTYSRQSKSWGVSLSAQF